MSQPPVTSTPFSRYVAIAAAFGVAAYQVTRGQWVEVMGLLGLGSGLVLLIAAGRGRQPRLRYVAWLCFAATVAAVVYVARRDY